MSYRCGFMSIRFFERGVVASGVIGSLLLGGVALAAGACSTKDAGNPAPPGAGSGGGGTAGSGGFVGSGGSVSMAGTPGIIVGTAGATDPGSCVSSCMPTGGRWCGVIGDNCGGKFECPACPAGWTCEEGLCVGDASCPRASCTNGDTLYCGTIGDGCGGALECGACPDGAACGSGGLANVCTQQNCTPRTCVDAESGGQYCGDIGDGCGGVLHCGHCADGKACGADGVANVCPGAKGCTNLQCTVITDACPATSPTTLTGTVYDPAGQLPLYNALVYVPNDPLPLPPIEDGARCDQCAAFAAGNPIATALTDVNGQFTLTGVPSGANVPIVIQVGKWRRQVTLNTTVTKCETQAITDVNLTRLPRNKSEGHIPRIAFSTGVQDGLECLLRRIGISDEEFTTDAGDGRVHMYVGGEIGMDANRQGADQFTPELGGAQFPHATTLWSDPVKLQSYDIMMLSCEGSEIANVKEFYRDNVFNYMNQGGRVFVDHLHFYWLRAGAPELQGTASYDGDLGDLPQPTTAFVDTSFPKGVALADWLLLTGASTMRGEIPIYEGQHSVSAVNAPTQRWIYAENPNSTRPSIQYMTFNTPVSAPPENQCGRVVYTDIHIGALVRGANGEPDLGGDQSNPRQPFPGGCSTNGMSPQAKALAFMFFDLSACVTPIVPIPVPPPAGAPPPASVPPPPAPPPPPPPR